MPWACLWALCASLMRISMRSASLGLLSQSSPRRIARAEASRSPETHSMPLTVAHMFYRLSIHMVSGSRGAVDDSRRRDVAEGGVHVARATNSRGRGRGRRSVRRPFPLAVPARQRHAALIASMARPQAIPPAAPVSCDLARHDLRCRTLVRARADHYSNRVGRPMADQEQLASGLVGSVTPRSCANKGEDRHGNER